MSLPLVAGKRDRLDDVVGDAGAHLVGVKCDVHRERLFADDLLTGPGHRDKIGQIDRVATGRPGRAVRRRSRRASFSPRRRCSRMCGRPRSATRKTRHCRGAPRPGTEYRGVGERPQDYRHSGTPAAASTARTSRNPIAPEDRGVPRRYPRQTNLRPAHRPLCVPSQKGLPRSACSRTARPLRSPRR